MRDEVASQPCRCVPCATCNGHGSICVEMITGKYIGPHPYDDLFDLAPCDECSGGIVEVCGRCADLEEVDGWLDEQ
jgi:hypothetical protein